MATAATFTNDAYVFGTEKRSEGPSHAERRIARQLDALQRMAVHERNSKYGGDWPAQMREFYNLTQFTSQTTPTYRPKVLLPEIQYLCMSEATDLTNDTPKTYICIDGKRDEQRERAFASMWRLGNYSNRVFDAVLWSQFVNPCFLQLGYDPHARNGKGMVWLRARDPETFYPDPHAKNDHDWSFVVAEDWFYVDEVKRMWGARADGIRVGAGYDDYNADAEQEGSRFDLSLELPPGPLRIDSPEGFEKQRLGPRVRVRYLWVKDYAVEVVKEIAGAEAAQGFELVVRPEKKWRFPHGRFIVECNSTILADGPNFIPKLPTDDFGTFPFVGVWSMPHLESIYGPPPVRYGKGPQDIAERMYTQMVENMIRLNNGITYIPRESEIDIDAFGGIPGEVHVFAGEKVPETIWPKEIPQHMTNVPELLLSKVQRYLGWSPERQGQKGDGNISADLFDASVFQGQTLVRMKARLLAETYERLTQMIFRMSQRFKTTTDTFSPGTSKEAPAQWNPMADDVESDVYLDEAAIRPMSSANLKSLALVLAKMGALPTRFLLETLGIPGAAELADQAEKQMALAAVAKLRKPR